MNPIVPTCSGEGVIFGEGQEEYFPLPARYGDVDLCGGKTFPRGAVVTEWQLTEEERRLVALGENVRLTLYTFGQRLQPVRLEVTTPEGT